MTAKGYGFDDDEDSERGDQPDDSAEAEGAAEPAKLKPFYGSEDEFVRKHLRYHYRRTVGRPNRANFRWRAQWWKSEEAASRIEGLWRSWEKLRLDPGVGLSEWWITHCDRQMSVLLSPDGPYALSQDENRPGDPLPYAGPQKGLFPEDNQPNEDT